MMDTQQLITFILKVTTKDVELKKIIEKEHCRTVCGNKKHTKTQQKEEQKALKERMEVRGHKVA